MISRKVLALLPALSVLLGAPGFAQDLEEARVAALQTLRAKLAGDDLVAAQAAPAPGRGSAGPTAVAGTGDAAARRLDALFALVAPVEAAAEAAADEVRLPRPRPADELVALAYAESVEPAEAIGAAAGLTAIEALVQKHAEANDVPAALAQALVQVESSHNPKATGRRGEIGLLQIKPQTARAMGFKGPAKALYDPETNLTWGMKYLGKAHDLSGGDICGTLRRYNAGLDAGRKSAASNKFCRKVKSVMAGRA